MKRKNKKTAGVFFLAVILIFVVLVAVSVDAAGRKGSITVQLNEIGTDREGTALECFYVAEQKENGWHLTEAFEGCKVTPWNLSKSADYKKAAEKLSSWVTAKKLSAEKRVTDADGKLVFEDLDEGIYLIRQKNGQKTYGAIAPFLVCVPMEENGEILYDIHTKSKGEEIQKITPTPAISVTPSPSATSTTTSASSGKNPSVKSSSSSVKTVKTGDDTALWVFWVLLILAAGGTVGILYYRKKH